MSIETDDQPQMVDKPSGQSKQAHLNGSDERGVIDVGIIIAGPLDSIDRRASFLAVTQVQAYLSETLPEFRFRFDRIRRPQLSGNGRQEPSVLLQQAAEDRDALHWDFAFVLTAAELVGIYSPYCFAALSRPLDASVFSLSLIDPQTVDPESDDETRVQQIARRLSRLMLHALGHLTGLAPSTDETNLLFRPTAAPDLGRMELLSDNQLQRQRGALSEIADLRLEEAADRQVSYPAFVARAAWINRREIGEAIWGARPWEFPRRLSRLTIASVSTIAVLFMTAEAWDLGLSQSGWRVALLVMLSLTLTTVYVVVRQQLLIRRRREISEQTVVTSTSALGIVLFGMLVTWISLFLIGSSFAVLLFRPDLVASWASSSGWSEDQIGLTATLQMSCFSASLGLLIGALGASFESQNYFRHIIFVDEEI